jgi:GTP cyclohydrolase II
MTNNPEKADQLRELGVNVAERRPLICGWDKPEIRKYLIDKRKVLGHDIPDDLDQLGNTEHQQ